MTTEDLHALKLCLDTGDINFFHGNLNEAFVEVVHELLNIRGAMDSSGLDWDDAAEQYFLSLQVLQQAVLELSGEELNHEEYLKQN